MAKYLDYVAFISESQGANDSLKIRDTEARALIQNNTNNIANLDAREQVDAAAIAANAAKNTEQDARLAVAEGAIEMLQDRVTATEQKNSEQDGRLDTAETDIDNLQTRMTAAEAKNTEQDGRLDTAETDIDDLETRMTAAETKNTEQDERITSNSNRLTTAETDIDNLETRMEAAEAKDAEQDQHLSDLDDAVAASTYEAGIGIYFGEGVHHTNINVDDEILAQIEQNRINIEILTQTKTELYDVNESTGDRINYPQLEIGPTLNVYNGKIDSRAYEVQFYFGADYTTLQGSANEVSAVVDRFFRGIHYTGTNDSYPYSGVLMARISSTMAENDEATYIPAVVTTHISAFYPAWIDMFVRDREGHPWLLSARVDGANIAPVIVSKRMSEHTDIEAINTRISALEGRMTAAEAKNTEQDGRLDTAETDIDAAQTNIANLTSRMSSAETTIAGHTTDIANLTNRMSSAETTIAGHTTDITNLTNRMSSAETTIAGHTTDIAGLTTRMNVAENTLTRVDGQVSQNTNDIDRLDQHMTTAEADIDAAQADITTLTGRMSSAETTIAGHTTDIAGLTTRMNVAENTLTRVDGQVSQNTNDIDRLDQHMTTAEADIDAAQADITTLTTSVSTVETKLARKTTMYLNSAARDLVKTDKSISTQINTDSSGASEAVMYVQRPCIYLTLSGGLNASGGVTFTTDGSATQTIQNYMNASYNHTATEAAKPPLYADILMPTGTQHVVVPLNSTVSASNYPIFFTALVALPGLSNDTPETPAYLKIKMPSRNSQESRLVITAQKITVT